MAITRAQQAKQMLQDGGMLVKLSTDGKRPGYRSARAQEAQGRTRDTGSDYGQFDRAVSRSQNNPSRTTSSGGGGDNRPDIGFQNALRQQKIEQKKKEAQDLGFRDTGSVKYSPPSFFQNLKNKNFQSGINRNKVAALRKMSLLDKGLPGFFGKFISGVTGKVPDWAKDMTEEELNELASDIQGIKDYDQATYNYNLNPDKKGSGSELLSRTFDAQNILDTGQMTQTDYEELFPGPTLPKDGDGPSDPCKGPNPPAYCFVGIRSVEPETPVEEEPFVRNFRLMAGGGMADETVGGIMDLESSRQMYGLGKLVKKVTRSVKKIAKSPIGKAALGFAAYKFGPAFLSGKGLGLGTAKKFSDLKFLGDAANVNLGRFIGIPALASYFMTPEEEEEKKLSAGADIADPSYIMNNPGLFTNRRLAAEGGDIEKEPVAKKVMPLLDMDGKEKDYRETGGFVDMGRMEKADDVPARLSKNEFVFTADAVRNAGDGSVDKGAEVMYNMMKNLESGGDVSEESQGLEGARKMFKTSQRLEEVL